ncbi:hypothetical protein EMN47_04090 [Prolixibacteraceae bacterium JC049]|nr:hypothetical protein [Prolixibacteraceae bacterium JC049]
MKDFLLEECIAMVKYIAAEGTAIPIEAEWLVELDEKTMNHSMESQKIIELHGLLAARIAPARPKTILLLYKESQKKKFQTFLGPVSLIRRLMLMSVLSLIAFIVIALSPDVNSKTVVLGVLEDNGFTLFLNMMFFLSAAALGACFSNLFEVNKYIQDGTYDPKYESAYWIRFILGLIAGLMLAVLLPSVLDRQAQGNSGMGFISVPLLAMVGGFSASLFHRILNRTVSTFETLLMGKQDKPKSILVHERLIQQHKELLKEMKNVVEGLGDLKNDMKKEEDKKDSSEKSLEKSSLN